MTIELQKCDGLALKMSSRSLKHHDSIFIDLVLDLQDLPTADADVFPGTKFILTHQIYKIIVFKALQQKLKDGNKDAVSNTKVVSQNENGTKKALSPSNVLPTVTAGNAFYDLAQ